MPMPPRAVARSAAVAGFGFVALFIFAAVLYGSGAGRQPDEIVAYYGSGGRWAQVAGFAVLTAGLAFFAVFVASLRALLGPAEPWSSLSLLAGVATLMCLLIANTLWASSAFTSIIETGYVIDPRTHLIFEDAGFTFLVAGGAMAALLVAAASLAMAAGAVFPRWLSWLGAPVAVALLGTYWYVPLFALFLWIAMVAGFALKHSPRSG